MSETIDSIIKAATDEIRDYFLKGIADGMADNTRMHEIGRLGKTYDLGYQIGKDAGHYRNSKTTATPTPPAKADVWPKVWITDSQNAIRFKRRANADTMFVELDVGSYVKPSTIEFGNPGFPSAGHTRLIPEARP